MEIRTKTHLTHKKHPNRACQRLITVYTLRLLLLMLILLSATAQAEDYTWSDDVDSYLQQYDHPLWKSMEEMSKGAGHGGMDFIEDFRLINALRKGLETDMDVYDAVAWSVVSELSERSIAAGSKPMKFPDFTRGKWKQARVLQVDTI